MGLFLKAVCFLAEDSFFFAIFVWYERRFSNFRQVAEDQDSQNPQVLPLKQLEQFKQVGWLSCEDRKCPQRPRDWGITGLEERKESASSSIERPNSRSSIQYKYKLAKIHK